MERSYAGVRSFRSTSALLVSKERKIIGIDPKIPMSRSIMCKRVQDVLSEIAMNEDGLLDIASKIDGSWREYLDPINGRLVSISACQMMSEIGIQYLYLIGYEAPDRYQNDISDLENSQNDTLDLEKRPLMIYDGHGKIISINDPMLKILGCRKTEKEAIRLLGSYVDPQYLDQLARMDGQGKDNDKVSFEMIVPGECRKELALGACLSRLLIGEQIAYLVAVDDIHPLDGSMSIHGNNDPFWSLAQNSSDPIMILTQDGLVKYANPSACSALGKALTEIVGKDCFIGMDLNGQDDPHKMLNDLAMTPGATVTRHFRIMYPDGSRVCLEVLLTNCLSDTYIHGIIANGRDITKHKPLQGESKRRYDILETVSRVSEKLMKSDSWSDNIGEVLESICDATKAYSARMLEAREVDEWHRNMKVRYRWTSSKGVLETEPQINF